MNINTLTDFLQQAQCQFRIYDLGRKVTKISNSAFQQVAENKQPYPYPIQQHAYIALTFWQVNKQLQDHFIWFLKLPVDEQGLLSITAQTSFIKMVVEAMGENLTGDISEDLQERLASNPFVFKPAAEKLAIFNAIMNTNFVRPASTFYPAALRYFSGQTRWSEWQELGIQGIADLAARLNYDNNQQTLINALPHLPQQPLQSLSLCLEHQHDINTDLATAIAQQAKAELKANHQENAILLLRALSSAPAVGISKALLEQQFNSDLIHNEHWYVCIAGRCWSMLEDETLLNRFFEALANHHPSLFPQLFVDLVAIPALREKVLKQLRLTARSPALSKAIGLLFSAAPQGEK
ncbi:hypothetical protein GCM10007916_03920 [Psychromonas marina]|uniref:DUF3549 family protein n=1 Tax=Psychromonas marina TaxID=88364 RepID=A0ABQ6DWF8_9GAMM|nr:DUF3549 family protein [Psychromonas marina]GLS89325.1 hypothetical protein GCM10007916_03920 [Psychromonas marina]